jgi:hypothetical protein
MGVDCCSCGGFGEDCETGEGAVGCAGELGVVDWVGCERVEDGCVVELTARSMERIRYNGATLVR